VQNRNFSQFGLKNPEIRLFRKACRILDARGWFKPWEIKIWKLSKTLKVEIRDGFLFQTKLRIVRITELESNTENNERKIWTEYGLAYSIFKFYFSLRTSPKASASKKPNFHQTTKPDKRCSKVRKESKLSLRKNCQSWNPKRQPFQIRTRFNCLRSREPNAWLRTQ